MKSVLQQAPGSLAVVKGWIRTVRKQKGVCFAKVDDGSHVDAIQVVLDPSKAGP